MARTGGHLGPNLGVVELTIALHRVFESPRDTLVFDTGHQSYVHKLLTGRQRLLGPADARRACRAIPSRAESEHDVVENSHASTSLSWADGIARARTLNGETDRYTVAVIGDGALTGGMAWEALNNIATGHDRRLIVVVNDNERSYAPTIGGMAHHLATLRTTRGYERFLEWGKQTLQRSGPPGRLAYEALHGMKKGIKDIVAPQGLFEDLGLKYIGPVDGHDTADVEHALRRAKAFGGPVIVHALTRKGNGYPPAMNHEDDQFHAVGVIDPETGRAISSGGASWTSAFADEMVQIGRERSDVVGVTAAMLIPVGLHKFAAEYPERVFDVGIAEQHAVTSAAGMAFAGLHPVVAVYATFLNRAFDQVLMDVALHKAGVTFVLDRAGVTGPGRRLAPRDVGPVDPPGRAGHPHRGAARHGAAGRGAARGGRGRRRPDRAAHRSRRGACRHRRAGEDRRGRRAAQGVCARRAGRQCRLARRHGSRRRGTPCGAGHRRNRRRPSLGAAREPRAASTWRVATGSW